MSDASDASDAYGAFDAVVALEDLLTRTFRTPGAGKSGRPFKVGGTSPDGLEIRTSRGGRVTLRREPFQEAMKVLADLAPDDPDGWVRVSDETLVAVLQSENRDRACVSYVLPLLEAVGRIEIERARPARARLHQGP